MKKENNPLSMGMTGNICPTPPMLVNEIARLFHTRMREVDFDGVMTQESARLIMRALAHRDGCSQLELVRETHLKPPTVSVTLKRMEDKALVRRETDADDRRTVRVFLTTQGQTLNRMVHDRLKSLDSLLMQNFSKEESEMLLSFLKRMRDNILPGTERNDTEFSQKRTVTSTTEPDKKRPSQNGIKY